MTKKQKYELKSGDKFLRFTVCDCDQGSEEEEQQQQQSRYDLRKREAAMMEEGRH